MIVAHEVGIGHIPHMHRYYAHIYTNHYHLSLQKIILVWLNKYKETNKQLVHSTTQLRKQFAFFFSNGALKTPKLATVQIIKSSIAIGPSIVWL